MTRTRLTEPRQASDPRRYSALGSSDCHNYTTKDAARYERNSMSHTKPDDRPKKLQKHRKDLIVADSDAIRRTTSLDVSSLSDNSHRALVNAHITVTSRYGAYPQASPKGVLRKRRDSRMVRTPYQPVASPTLPRMHGARNEQPFERAAPLSDDHPFPNCRFQEQPRIPHVTQHSSQESLPIVHPNENTHLQSDGSDSTPRTTIHEHSWTDPRDKPLPKTPIKTTRLSAYVEQFSPTSENHRRWTMSSYNDIRQGSIDILADDVVQITRGDPKANASSSSPSLPLFPPKPIEKDPSQVKLQRLISEFISSQRSYLETLRRTVGSDSSDACGPPVNLLLCILSIIQVSEEFAQKMEWQASPAGVAHAFLATCGQLETHLLQWSREVTEFMNTQSPEVELDSLRHYYQQSTTKSVDQHRQPPIKRWTAFFKRKPSTPLTPPIPQDKEGRVLPDQFWQRSDSGPGLWEMLVLPTQRTMRYAFVFREMLSLLDPTHKDYQVVDRAFHAATCIAKKMTRAQQRPSLYFV